MVRAKKANSSVKADIEQKDKVSKSGASKAAATTSSSKRTVRNKTTLATATTTKSNSMASSKNTNAKTKTKAQASASSDKKEANAKAAAAAKTSKASATKARASSSRTSSTKVASATKDSATLKSSASASKSTSSKSAKSAATKSVASKTAATKTAASKIATSKTAAAKSAAAKGTTSAKSKAASEAKSASVKSVSKRAVTDSAEKSASSKNLKASTKEAAPQESVTKSQVKSTVKSAAMAEDRIARDPVAEENVSADQVKGATLTKNEAQEAEAAAINAFLQRRKNKANEEAQAKVDEEQEVAAAVHETVEETKEDKKALVTDADATDSSNVETQEKSVKSKRAKRSSTKQSDSDDLSADKEKDVSADKNTSTSDYEVVTDNEGNTRTAKFPLITLRSIVITPSANVQLIAARENTVLTLQEALKSDKNIAVFTQLADSDVRPTKDELGRVGVVAKVLSAAYNDKEQYRATIRGYERVVISRIIDDPADQVRHVEVEFLKEVEVDPVIEKRYIDALRNALDNALEVQKHGGRNIIEKNIPSELIVAVRELAVLGQLADGLAQILNLPFFDKKYILETLNPVARAKAVIAFLNNFSYKAEVDKKIAEDARAAMDRSQRDFYLNEQLKAIKRELNIQVDDSNDLEEYRNKVANLDAPVEVINRLQKEISRLAIMPLNTGENSMVRNYIDTLLSIPWSKSTEINKELAKARDVLEQEHYGLKKVKDRILEFLAVQSRREQTDTHGQILCLMGPPGIGKTSLAASIAKATGRKYVRVALGGMYDESEIRGHRRTYIGAMPGRIIQGMIKCEVNNPLFLLDEIDKISTNTYHGDISAALLEVLDPEQNSTFSDNYVDLEYDLSKVLFIATANSYNIPPALSDRMEIIDLSSYTADEKFHIAREHLLPKQLRRNGLSEDEFDISDAGLKQLIVHYTMEAGVRALERIIAELCRKVVKDLMLNPPKTPKKTVLGVKEIEKLIGPKRYDYTSKLKDNRVGVVNGLSVSSVGGDMLQVEVIANEGKGTHLLTGQLGSVMKESVFAAIAWVRSHAREFSLAPDFYQSVDLNVHFPEGAIKKDGPSAGSATTTAIVSALTGNPVRSDVAMTGEITLRGDVLAIGGLKEKLLAALRGGVKTVCIPFDNKKDLWDIPENVTKGLKIVPVKTIDEVLDIALESNPRKFKPTTPEDWTLSGYEKREAQRKLRAEAEERKYAMEIKDSSEIAVGEIHNNKDEEETPKPTRRRRRDDAQKRLEIVQ